MMRALSKLSRRWMVLSLSLLVVACGGGGVAAVIAGIDRLGITQGIVIAFGSVIVGGVEYETTGASFDVDGNPAVIPESI